VLSVKGVHPSDYNAGKASPDVYECVGKPGSSAPFSVCGPLFLKDGKLVIPCPYTWNIVKDEKIGSEPDSLNNEKDRGNGVKPVAVFISQKTTNTLCVGKNAEYWVKGPVMEMKSAGGNWIYADSLVSNEPARSLISAKDLYKFEIRTGIALDTKNRTAREGYLYSLTHVRLNPGVKLVFGVDRELPPPLPAKGFCASVGAAVRLV
jgi:hypothetical protein